MNVTIHFLVRLLLVFSVWSTATSHAQRLVPVEDAPCGRFPTRVGPSPDSVFENPFARNTARARFAMWGYCYAGSYIQDREALGGFGRSNNMPKKITEAAALETQGFYLLAQPEVVTRWGTRNAMRLVVVNASSDTIVFPASDSRLNIIQQAMDRSGFWRPIEYLPWSFCGNSYHRLFLRQGEFWSFPVLRYKGAFPTQLRFCLVDHQDSVIAKSNEFPGSVNEAQFSVRASYESANIMDPY